MLQIGLVGLKDDKQFLEGCILDLIDTHYIYWCSYGVVKQMHQMPLRNPLQGLKLYFVVT